MANRGTSSAVGGNNWFGSFLGWGISTLLLWLLRDKSNRDDGTSDQQPSKYTDSNVNQIGSAIPVVLGRAMIKNPLVSYYGDFSYRPYTESYGMHSDLNVWAFLLPLLLSLILIVSRNDKVILTAGTGTEVPSGATSGGVIGSGTTTPSQNQLTAMTSSGPAPVEGTIDFGESGKKRAMIVNIFAYILLWLLNQLFNKHAGKVTIQKGFKYYLGWQHIICWTDDNIGLKRIWMNVYDSEVKASTQTGVWGNDDVAWKLDNIPGLIAVVDNEDMFGGVEEGGGFVGRIHVYFGHPSQPIDAWMQEQMYNSQNVPNDLKGLTPRYPMYMTCVINSSTDYTPAPTPPSDPINVVVIGDSYSASMSANDFTPWTTVFASDTGYNVTNVAIAGTDSQDGLSRFISDVVAKDPDYVIIEYGNDWFFGINNFDTTTKFNYDAMIDLCESNDIQVRFVQPICPLNLTAYTGSYAGCVEARAYHEKMMDYVTGLGFPCVDMVEPLMIDDYNIDMSKIYTDGVHLTKEGSEIVGHWIASNYNNFRKPYESKPVSAQEVAGGAYIGKQATIPEMWFEVVNYPGRLGNKYQAELTNLYNGILNDLIAEQTYLESLDYSKMTLAQRFRLDNVKSRRTFLQSHGVWTLGRLEDDLNPAEAIYSILTNEYWGCDYSEDRIDEWSLCLVGVTCEELGLGVSCLINRTSQAKEYIDKILSHINGVKYDDPKTGKLTFKLIRNDYNVDELKVFDVTNCKSLEFSRLDWSETVSAVSVNYIRADEKFADGELTVQDVSNPLITGSYTQSNVDGTYFTTARNAKTLAQNQLIMQGYPLASINISCGRYGYDVTVGDPIIVTWEPYGIERQIFRVTDVDYGTLTNGLINITAIEDVYGFAMSDYTFSEAPSWTDPEYNPADIIRYKYMEMPYEMTCSLNTWINAYAASPSEYVTSWSVLRDV